jgi:hypothetical protein
MTEGVIKAIKKVMSVVNTIDKPKIKLKEPKPVSSFKKFVKNKWL